MVDSRWRATRLEIFVFVSLLLFFVPADVYVSYFNFRKYLKNSLAIRSRKVALVAIIIIMIRFLKFARENDNDMFG